MARRTAGNAVLDLDAPAQTHTREMTLSPTLPANREPEPDNLLLMFERLAKDASVDVEKLQRLIDMQREILKVNAEAAFNSAFVRMQPEIPTIIEHASTDKTTYATLEDIIEVIRPIIARHGFTLAHRTEWPDKQTVKVVGILTHAQGHSRESEFLAAADQTGSKNAIQALGSSVSYGKRYTTKDLLCIVTRGEDDDGRNHTKKDAPASPEGYDAWIGVLEGLAKDGFAGLSAAFNQTQRKDFRNYLTRHDNKTWEAMKATALAVDNERKKASAK